MPVEQIKHLSENVMGQCKWFPTISECLELASAWVRDDDEVRHRAEAIAMIAHEEKARFHDVQQQFEDAMRQLARHEMTQEQFDALPERYQHLAGVRGLVRQDGEKYIVRDKPVDGL